MSIIINNVKLTFDGIDIKKKYDKLTPKSITKRTGNYDIRDYIRNKWKGIINDNINVNMNLCNNFILSDNINEGIIIEKKVDLIKYEKSFINCISSPMLLYRCCCIFPNNVNINNEYKQIWTCFIKNKESNNIILLSEIKGTPYIGIENNFENINEIPNQFLNDILELLNYLLSDQCVHPYDNIVAGTHA